MISWESAKEYCITIGVFSGILFPLRLLFYHFLSNYWIGSFGLITAVTLSLLYLAKKGKLGKVGNILIRRFYKRAKDKSGIAAILFSCFFIYFLSLGIIGITFANDSDVKIIKSGLNKDGINNIHDAVSKTPPNATWNLYLKAVLLIITPNQTGAIFWKLTNEMTDGWILSFFTVDLVEAIEVLGLTFYLRYTKVLEVGK